MKDTVTACGLRCLRIGGDVGCGDGGAEDRCAGSIGDPAFNAADGRLRREHAGENGQSEQREGHSDRRGDATFALAYKFHV